MKEFAETVGHFVLLFAWLAGMVLANGVLSTMFAFFFPPWGWYLIVERMMQSLGWV